MGLVSKVLDCESELGQSLFIFWETAKHYPAWLYNGNDGHVWPQVSAAIGSNLDDRQDIILRNGNTFTFTLQSIQSYSDAPKYDLEIYCNKKIIAFLFTQTKFDSHIFSGFEYINNGVWTRDLSDFLEWKKIHDEKAKKEIDERAMKQAFKEKQIKTIGW